MPRRTRLISSGMQQLLEFPEVRALLTAKAEIVASAARASAPVDTGAYRDSIRVEQDTTDRVAVRVGSYVFYGIMVEANTGNLVRALDAAR